MLDSSLIDRIGLHQGAREPITVQKAEKAYDNLRYGEKALDRWAQQPNHHDYRYPYHELPRDLAA